MEFTAELYLIIVIVYTFQIHCYDLASIKIICIHCAETLVFFKTTLLVISLEQAIYSYSELGMKNEFIIIYLHYPAIGLGQMLCSQDNISHTCVCGCTHQWWMNSCRCQAGSWDLGGMSTV